MPRVVVTGARGGTGRSIVKVLRKANYDVVTVDVLPQASVGAEPHYMQLDVTDGGGVNDVFAGADYVVHFGSYPTDAWHADSEVFRNIAVGGFNVLQAAANVGIKRLVLASSMDVYGSFTQPMLPVDEQYPLQPRSIYGLSKMLIEQMAQHYCRWHGMSVAALRLGRIVYENSFEQRLRAHTVDDASAADVLWCYIDSRDVGTACRAWLESDHQGFEAFNLAANDVCVETPVAALLQRFYPHVTDVRLDLGLHDCPYLSHKFQKTLKWNPIHNWRDLRREHAATRPCSETAQRPDRNRCIK